jgi:hypothetical protein
VFGEGWGSVAREFNVEGKAVYFWSALSGSEK